MTGSRSWSEAPFLYEKGSFIAFCTMIGADFQRLQANLYAIFWLEFFWEYMAFICEKKHKNVKRQKNNVKNANKMVDFKEWI